MQGKDKLECDIGQSCYKSTQELSIYKLMSKSPIAKLSNLENRKAA